MAYNSAKNHSLMKKRMKRDERHLLPPFVKKNPIERYLDRLEHERKVDALRDLAQSPPPTKVIVPVGPRPTAAILPVPSLNFLVRPPSTVAVHPLPTLIVHVGPSLQRPPFAWQLFHHLIHMKTMMKCYQKAYLWVSLGIYLSFLVSLNWPNSLSCGYCFVTIKSIEFYLN